MLLIVFLERLGNAEDGLSESVHLDTIEKEAGDRVGEGGSLVDDNDDTRPMLESVEK